MGTELIRPTLSRGRQKHNDLTIVVDDYAEQLRELFYIQHPPLAFAPDKAAARCDSFIKGRDNDGDGNWVYYPWINTTVHILSEEEFFTVRTARNRNLITADEQLKFYNAKIGIGGLSIGNSVAVALVLQGGAKHIRLADFDRLALSNTNRVRSSVANLGELKVVMTARHIYEINPYADVRIFSDGLTKENVEEFMTGLDLVIDELDNLAVKYLIREYAKKLRLPIVMAADNGDNAVVDIERYDQDPQPEFFHGRMGNVTYDELAGLDKQGIGKMITKHIGAENVTERMQASLLEMGKTIVSWPQLGGAALINGAAVAYCVRRIICGQELEPNRALVSLDAVLIPSHNSPTEISKRSKIADSFKEIFGL